MKKKKSKDKAKGKVKEKRVVEQPPVSVPEEPVDRSTETAEKSVPKPLPGDPARSSKFNDQAFYSYLVILSGERWELHELITEMDQVYDESVTPIIEQYLRLFNRICKVERRLIELAKQRYPNFQQPRTAGHFDPPKTRLGAGEVSE